jgi:hypothetical protein
MAEWIVSYHQTRSKTLALNSRIHPKKIISATEDSEAQCIPGATIQYLAGDGGAGVKRMILSGFFRVIPWQMRFIGS